MCTPEGAWHPGHTGVDLWTDLQLRNAQRLHTSARGLAARHHQLTHAQAHQATRHSGQCVFDQSARLGHAQLGLNSFDGLGFGGGVHQHRAIFQKRRGPGQHLLQPRHRFGHASAPQG